jgi:hypothetical protein
VDPVSDNSIRFHERTRLLITLAKSLFFSPLFLVVEGWMLKPANPSSGALRIRRQTGRLSGWREWKRRHRILWWLCDGAIVSDGEERGGSFLLVLHDDVVVQCFGSLCCQTALDDL